MNHVNTMNSYLYAETILNNPYIPHHPTEKQRQFLLYNGREALYGGAAGGGKSDVLLMAALQYVTEPEYAALLLRRTFPDLSKPGCLIPRAKEWLHGTDATWSEQRKEWTFPSGAKLVFGYLEREDDKYQYQSSEFQSIGFDELTQFSEEAFTYLFSRLRRPDGCRIPLRMRCASNPGGKGHEWVKQRFITSMDLERLFIPARLEDNPYIDRASYVESLHYLTSINRQQLLEGDWDAVLYGGLVRPEWLQTHTSPLSPERVIIGVDPSIGEGDRSDYTAMVAVAKQGDRLVVIGARHGRWTMGERIEEIRRFAETYAATRVVVEKTSMSADFIGVLSDRLRGVVPVQPISPGGRDKTARLQTILPRIEDGTILFTPGLNDLRDELLVFPHGSYDDLVDALVYAVMGLQRGTSSERFMYAYRS